MRKGFTLIELSIVLVIIGLLIGGILVGQSLVESARITAQVRQIQQLDIAVNNFVGKYRFLPGDSPALPVAGNGDGILTDASNTRQIYSGELMNFWNHLINSELKGYYNHNNNNGIIPSGSIIPGTNCPKAVIGENATILGQSSDGSMFPLNTRVWHIRKNFIGGYHLFNSNEGSGQASPLTVLETANLDAKIDDGNAITGDVRASDGKRTGQPWSWVSGGVTEGGCVLISDTSKYDSNKAETPTASDRPCGAVIKMQVYR